MISVKEYARANNVTNQAVYKKISLHREELGSHVKIKNGIKMLDSKAVEILDRYTVDVEKYIKKIKQLELQNKELSGELEKCKEQIEEYTIRVVAENEMRSKLELSESMITSLNAKIEELENELQSEREQSERYYKYAKEMEERASMPRVDIHADMKRDLEYRSGEQKPEQRKGKFKKGFF